MFRRGLLPLLLILFLIFALAGKGRSAAYREGWTQGYYAAQQAEDGDGRAPAAGPAAGPYDQHGWHQGAGFAFFPLLCLFGLVLMAVFFAVLGTVGRCIGKRMHKGHHWHGRHHDWHGKGKPFWAAGDDEPLDDTIRKA